MVLCINRFAQAELIATNNIGHASQKTEEIFWEQNPLSIKLNKNSKDNNQTKLYDDSQLLQISNDSKHPLGQNSQSHLLNWTEQQAGLNLLLSFVFCIM